MTTNEDRAPVDTSDESAPVRKLIEWFEHYFEPAINVHASQPVVSIFGTLREHFTQYSEQNLNRAHELLFQHAQVWAVRNEWLDPEVEDHIASEERNGIPEAILAEWRKVARTEFSRAYESPIDTSGEKLAVRKAVRWFTFYYQPTRDIRESVSVVKVLDSQSQHDEVTLARIADILNTHASLWVMKPRWRSAEKPLPDLYAPTQVNAKELPPFIALKGAKGTGYVRVDRIELLTAVEPPKAPEIGTIVHVFGGGSAFSRETPDEIFMKMTEALQGTDQ